MPACVPHRLPMQGRLAKPGGEEKPNFAIRRLLPAPRAGMARPMSERSATLTVLAPAKVNLSLHILGRRADGYHELDSLLVPIDLCDELVLVRTAGGAVALSIEELGGATFSGLPPDAEDNLVTRAARLLHAACGVRAGVTIHLRKRIPIGGGLGGGSADAAATLTGLDRLWNLGLPRDRLLDLAARVGSDVPALVYGRAVRMQGRGERVTPLSLAPSSDVRGWWLVLAHPGFPVPTRDVYARLVVKSTLTPAPETDINLRLALEKGDVERGARSLHNGLQATVFAKYPLLAMLAGALTKAGAVGVLLSGSGASVFGVARDEGHARAVEAGLRAAIGSWLWTRVARTLPDGVMVAHGPLEARV